MPKTDGFMYVSNCTLDSDYANYYLNIFKEKENNNNKKLKVYSTDRIFVRLTALNLYFLSSCPSGLCITFDSSPLLVLVRSAPLYMSGPFLTFFFCSLR